MLEVPPNANHVVLVKDFQVVVAFNSVLPIRLTSLPDSPLFIKVNNIKIAALEFFIMGIIFVSHQTREDGFSDIKATSEFIYQAVHTLVSAQIAGDVRVVSGGNVS